MITGGDMVITQKEPVDDIFDDRVVIGNGVLHRSIAVTDTWDTLEPVRAAYRAAHQGVREGNSSELQSYITTPDQNAALQRLIQSENWEN